MSLAIQSVISLWKMEGSNLGFSQYDYSHIKEATNNFSVGNKLGQGGFGHVYKVLCPYIANGPIKRIKHYIVNTNIMPFLYYCGDILCNGA
jgi:hypothetical protein